MLKKAFLVYPILGLQTELHPQTNMLCILYVLVCKQKILLLDLQS